jgi:hypothetical protein
VQSGDCPIRNPKLLSKSALSGGNTHGSTIDGNRVAQRARYRFELCFKDVVGVATFKDSDMQSDARFSND